METFFVTYDQFWDWFNRDEEPHSTETELNSISRIKRFDETDNQISSNKRMRTENKPPRTLMETQAGERADARYIMLYGRHKPGKKHKSWEDDGYLSLVGQVAHICDLRGRLLEEPTLLDEIDYEVVKELGELTIGNTDVQILELDKR